MDKSNLKIKHEGKGYRRDNPQVRLIGTDFHEVVDWSQHSSEPPQYLSTISGTAKVDGYKLGQQDPAA